MADDVLSVLTLAIFYPKSFAPSWLLVSLIAIAALFALNRWRVYATWPYVVVTILLWVSLHSGGVHGALAGIGLAIFLPTRPAPAVGPLLAQAATALAELEHAENEERQSGGKPDGLTEEPIWEWASRNLSAASERLMSPADRIERAVAPWSNYVVLPLFAFSATGVALDLHIASPDAWRILIGVVLGLVIGKPLGISLVTLVAPKLEIARGLEDVTNRAVIGAACLCGVGDTVALLMADQAFEQEGFAAIAKTGVLIGSVIAAALGATIVALEPRGSAKTASDSRAQAR